MGSVLTRCTWAFLDGELRPTERAVLPADNHAMHFGSAAFESFRVYRTPRGLSILGLRRHLDRLRGSLRYFAAQSPADDQIAEALWSTIEQNGIEEGYLRLLVFPSGSCARFDPATYRWDLLILGFHAEKAGARTPVRLGVSQVRRPPVGSTLPRAKLTGFYAADVAAHAAAHRQGFDDALVLHHDGTVCEVTGANVFLVRDDQLTTPLLAGTIDGVTRRLVMDMARSLRIGVREAALPLADFIAADEVFIAGTYHEICAVASIGDAMIGRGTPGQLTQRLQQRLSDVIRDANDPLGADWLTPKAAPRDADVLTPRSFTVDDATPEDVPHVVEAIRCLLEELRGAPTTLPPGATEVCARILSSRSSGAIFVARSSKDASVVGVIAASLQDAIHLGGRYALIQDLWVRPDHRSRGVGTALIQAMDGYGREQQLESVEVCLPRYTSSNLSHTYRFYASCGFTPIGPRMRKVVS